MTDHKTPGRDLSADALAALDKLRTFASGRSDEIMGAIDSVGDFIDARTKGRFAEHIDKVQATAKKTLAGALKTPAEPAATTSETPVQGDPFSLDEHVTWKQPPSSPQPDAASAAPGPSADVKAAVTKLRGFAADHADDLTALVDKVGEYVDKAGELAKDRIRKLK